MVQIMNEVLLIWLSLANYYTDSVVVCVLLTIENYVFHEETDFLLGPVVKFLFGDSYWLESGEKSKVDPPIQTEYSSSVRATTLIFMLEPDMATISHSTLQRKLH